MSVVKLLKEYVDAFQLMSGIVRSNNTKWILNTTIEQIANGKLKHKDLTFPENAEFIFNESFATLLYHINNGKEYKSKENGSNINVVGHIQISENEFEIKQDCSFLYFIIGYVCKEEEKNKWGVKIQCLIRLIYDGIKNKKITNLPDNFGFYVFVPNVDYYEINDLKDTLKDVVSKRMNRIFYDRPFGGKFIIKPEEFYWFTENVDIFFKKLDIKFIQWENLFSSIENSEIKNELNEVYEISKIFAK